jgi:hypothetical protein
MQLTRAAEESTKEPIGSLLDQKSENKRREVFSVILLCGYFFLSISTTAMAMITAIAAPIVLA